MITWSLRLFYSLNIRFNFKLNLEKKFKTTNPDVLGNCLLIPNYDLFLFLPCSGHLRYLQNFQPWLYKLGVSCCLEKVHWSFKFFLCYLLWTQNDPTWPFWMLNHFFLLPKAHNLCVEINGWRGFQMSCLQTNSQLIYLPALGFSEWVSITFDYLSL